MLGWFQAIMPKEDKFFDLFEQHAGLVVAGAEALRSLLKGGDQVEHYREQIFALENEADEVARQVLIAVRRTFITPFDRSDIQDLIGSLDDAIDQMNKTAKIITLFEVRSFEPQMQQMGEISVAGVEAGAARRCRCCAPSARMPARSTRSPSRSSASRNAPTSCTTRAARRCSLPTARDAGNAMNFTIGTEIYDHLEKVVDRLEDVANEINALVIDHL